MSSKIDSAKKFFRLDGWENILTGIGLKSKDRDENTNFASDARISDLLCRALYRGEGLARRLVQLIVGDMFREGFEVDGDTDNVINTYLRQSGLYTECVLAMEEGFAFGGSAILLGINDGGDLDEELNEDNMKELVFFKKYDRTRVNVETSFFSEDANSKFFGKPEYYNINDYHGNVFKVHASRLVFFQGENVDEQTYISNNYWNDSFYQALYKRIRSVSTSYTDAEKVIHDLYTYVVKMQGLAAMVGGNEHAQTIVSKRLNQQDMSRHFMNSIVIDTEEDVSKVSASLSGLPQTLEKVSEGLAMETGTPVSLLMGTPPSGLSNDDKTGLEYYYNMISQRQEKQVYKPMKRIVEILMKIKDGPTNGQEIEGWDITFNPLAQQSEEQMVKNRETQSKTDERNILNRMLKPEEGRKSRFGGDKYSYETIIDDSEVVEESPDDSKKEIDELEK